MARRKYTDEERAAGLKAVAHYNGNCRAASVATGIPARTLQGWAKWVERGKQDEHPKKGGADPDPSWIPAFLETLAKTCNVSRAIEASGTSRTTAYDRRETDKAFAAAWDAAKVKGADVLEDEATRRAVEGVEEPVGFYQGESGTMVTKYSDTLLIFLLKGAKPAKYRENVDVTSDGEKLPGAIAIIRMNPDDL